MPDILKPDICVIGAGSGGLTVAAAAASFGVPVVLVERGRMGGDCLNFGCVPSKSLIASARQAHALRHGAHLGIADVEPDVDFARVNAHLRSVMEAIAPNDSAARFTALGVKVIRAQARFVDRRTVEAGDVRIRARRFVIATGSSPAVPPIPGLEDVAYLTNETVFDLKRRPNHLVVVGGGAMGVELGQAFASLGSRVSLVETGHILAREDPDMVRMVRAGLERDGVSIREESEIIQVEQRGKTGVRVIVVRHGVMEAIDASHILIAAGRRANVDALDLPGGRIKVTERGIKVGPRLRTSNRRVYAIGDVTGGPQFTHVASYHAGIVLRAILFRQRAWENRAILSRAIYTTPELAQAGLTEAEALASRKGVSILRWPYSENDRARAEGASQGFIKLMADREGRLIGASIVGRNAAEMINLYALALSKKMTVKDIAGFVSPYPTLTEIGKRAAITYFAPITRKPSVRRLIRFLRIFG